MTTAAPALDAIVEAALLASEAPLDLEALQQLFEGRHVPSRGALRAALTTLEQRLSGTAMTLHSSVSGFRLAIDKAFAPWLSRLWEERPQRYSRALMETLALIAYRQPVTRGDIEDVRGVAVSASIMRTLLDRGWIRVIGQRDVPGRPSVYATTRRFLDDFNLQTLDELPPLHDIEARFGSHAQMALDDQDSDAAAQHNEAVLNGLLHPEEADAAAHDNAALAEPLDDSDIDALVPPPLAGESLDFSTLQARLDARVEAAASARRAEHNDVLDGGETLANDEWLDAPESEEDAGAASIPPHDERSLNDE